MWKEQICIILNLKIQILIQFGFTKEYIDRSMEQHGLSKRPQSKAFYKNWLIMNQVYKCKG
jgi:hypothetical protein